MIAGRRTVARRSPRSSTVRRLFDLLERTVTSPWSARPGRTGYASACSSSAWCSTCDGEDKLRVSNRIFDAIPEGFLVLRGYRNDQAGAVTDQEKALDMGQRGLHNKGSGS